MKLLGCVSKIVSKKQLLLLLALVCLAPAFASDNGFGVVESKGGTRAEVAAQAPVDAWGEVVAGAEERAGSPRIAAGAGAGVGSATVELKIAGETLAIPQVSLDQFEMLPRFVEWSQLKPAGQSLEKNDIFNAENLRVLLDLVQNQRAEDYSLEELVDAVLLADYLLINDWQVLGENFPERFLEKFNAQASPELALRISNMNSALRLPFVEAGLPIRSRADVGYIDFNNKGYWVRFWDGKNRLYRQEDGKLVGNPLLELEDDYRANWSPDGSCYWMRFRDTDTAMARRYARNSMQPCDQLERVMHIDWHPDGSGYWVTFMDRVARRYNKNGEQQGEPLEWVENIKWSPDGSSYWVIFYHAGPFGRRAIRYNQAGEQLGEPLEHVSHIAWSPDSSSYWVIFADHRAIRYNQAGEQQGEALTNVTYIAWSPDSLGYSVRFRDKSTKLYKSIFNNLPLYEQVLVQYIMNHKNSTGKTARLAKEYLDLLSPDTLKRLQAAGYLELFYQVGDYVGWFDINDAGAGSGAGAGAGVGAGSGASGSKDLDHDHVD